MCTCAGGAEKDAVGSLGPCNPGLIPTEPGSEAGSLVWRNLRCPRSSGWREGRVVPWEDSHPGLQTWAQALVQEFELILCPWRQGQGASPFLTCVHLPPLTCQSCGPQLALKQLGQWGNRGWTHPTTGMMPSVRPKRHLPPLNSGL